jgi:hypothetical protein
MSKNPIKEQFYKWLSERESSKLLSNLYLRIDDIDNYCLKNGILKASILETTDIETISKVRTIVSKNNMFTIIHRKQAKDYSVIVNRYYVFIKDVYTHNAKEADGNDSPNDFYSNSDISSNYCEFDLSLIPDLKHTKPVTCKLKDRFCLESLDSWRQLYVLVATELLKRFPNVINSIKNKRFPGSSRVEITTEVTKTDLRKPVAIGYGLFIETNHSATTIATRLKYLITKCDLPLTALTITYLNENRCTSKASKNTRENNDADKPNSEFIREFSKWLVNDQSLSPSTARNYTSGISYCESFMVSNGIGSGKLYEATNEEVISNCKTFLKNEEFLKVNAAQHNRLSAAIVKFAFFRNIGIEELAKARVNSSVGSINSNKKAPITQGSQRKDDVHNFIVWLKTEKGCTDSTSRGYASTITSCEKFMRDHNFGTGVLFAGNSSEIKSNVEKLLGNQDFLKRNSEKRFRFFASLKQFLEYKKIDSVVFPTQQQKNEKEQVKKQNNRTIDTELASAIETFVKKSESGVAKEEICKQFPNYKTRQINLVLESNCYVCILGKFYHTDSISDYHEMADVLLEVILRQFSTQGDYTSAKILYDEVRPKLDDFFFYNNAFDSRQEIYDFACHLFAKEKINGYEFIFADRTHIWKEEPDYTKNYCGLLIKYAREHGNVFSRDEASDYFEQIGSSTAYTTLSNTLLYIGSELFLQYADNQFVLAEALNVDDEFLSSLQSQIEKLLEGDDYIAMGDIDDYFYETLPVLPIGVYWSALLLKEVLRVYDTAFETIEAGNDNDRKTIPAAIVRKNSFFKAFGDIVFHEVSTTYSLPKEFTATEFRDFLLDREFIRGSEKMWTVHKTVAGDIRFYWTDNNGRVTIN